MDLNAALLSPGKELQSESPIARALFEDLTALFTRIKRAFGSSHVAERFPGVDVRPAINARDPFLGSMCLGLSLGESSDPTSLAFLVANSNDFLVGLKSDGVRYLLALTENGGVFLVNRSNALFELRSDDRPKLISLFDGELVTFDSKQTFLLFDAILVHNELLFATDYLARLSACRDFEREQRFQSQFEPFPLHLLTKDFFPTFAVRFLLERLGSHPLFAGQLDGLIFARRNFPYLPGRSPGNLKWKPEEMNSIDFLIEEGEHGSLFELYVGRQDKLMLFDFCFADAAEAERLRAAIAGQRPCIAEMVWEPNAAAAEMTAAFAGVWARDADVVDALIRRSRLGAAFAGDAKAIYTLFNNVERRMRGGVIGNWRMVRVRLDKQVPNWHSTAENILLSLHEEAVSVAALIAAVDSSKTI